MIDSPETFLDVRFAKLALVCTRRECSVQVRIKQNLPNFPPLMRDLVIELPERCLPEEAVMIRAKHLQLHKEDVIDDTAEGEVQPEQEA